MKSRIRKIANFFAFNLLFFALYLNFIHKDESALNGLNQVANTSQPAAFGSTTVATDKKNTPVQQETNKEESAALKLSIN
ncbi:MAG TPA: hypothetical protein VFV31_00930 [Chitinophagaceae bacterium]|nr:hypothetical protein [Chitinophagaceae bacterium]